jgi:hypothetical protein
MHVHRFRVFATWPAEVDVILSRERGGILIKPLPSPAVGLALILDAQASIALKPRGDEEAACASGFPDCFGTVPTLQEDMGKRTSHGFKALDEFDQQVDFVLERNLLSFADVLLSIKAWWQWAAPLQEDIQPLNEAMSTHPSLMGRRVMLADAFHLAAFLCVHRRVVSD